MVSVNIPYLRLCSHVSIIQEEVTDGHEFAGKKGAEGVRRSFSEQSLIRDDLVLVQGSQEIDVITKNDKEQ